MNAVPRGGRPGGGRARGWRAALRCALLRGLSGLLAALVAPGIARAQPSAAPLEADEPAVVAVRLGPGERVPLDGGLSHPAWQRAPAFDGFQEFAPRNGSTPAHRTEVRVLFDEHALYVGVKAHDPEPAAIRDLAVRFDGVNRTQDFVVAYVDAIGTKRSAQFFRINAAGSLADGMHTAADDSEDFAPDFDWDGAAQRQDDGWSAVFRLPFAALRFDRAAPGAAARPWRFMVARRVPREQFHLLTSVALPWGAPSFIHRLQPLQGVQLPAGQAFLTLRPSLTARRTEEIADAAGRRVRRDELDATLDVKWRPRAELVVDATLNPDFSQVALDVPQLAGNTSFALALPEKRPFFFESSDLWRSPTEALYTRSLTEPRAGLRATWRSTAWAGTGIAVQDRGGGLVLLPGPYGTGVAGQPASRVLAARVRRDDGALHWGGLMALRRYDDGRGANDVAGPDLHWRLDEDWRLDAQALVSRTTAQPGADGSLARGATLDGHRVYGQLVRQTSNAETRLTLGETSPHFRHDTGFVNQAGVRSGTLFQSRGWPQLGPFNQFYVNLELHETRDRLSGDLVYRHVRPGLWSEAARNLEWWFNWFALSERRVRPGGELLREHYVQSSLTMTPAAWWPLVSAEVALGRLADTEAERVRRGARLNFSGKLRPLRALEVDPTLLLARLRPDAQSAGGSDVYREQALQVLAVWHFDAQHSLRAIAEQLRLKRRAEPGVDAFEARSHTGSLTYAWRRSTGTVFHVGATRQVRREPAADAGRTSEAFVKLQVDVDEFRRWW
jgi:hypothetical protein